MVFELFCFNLHILFQSLNEGLIDIDCSWNSFRNRGGAALLSCLAVSHYLIIEVDLDYEGFYINTCLEFSSNFQL